MSQLVHKGIKVVQKTNTLSELKKNIYKICLDPSNNLYRTYLANYNGNDYLSLFGNEFPNDDQIVIARNDESNIQLMMGILQPKTSVYYNNFRHIKVLDGPIDIELNKTGDCSRFEFRKGAITLANSHYIHNSSNKKKSFLWIDKISNNDIPLL